MIRTPIRAMLGLAFLSVAVPAAAGDVYQWKDAKGVTHYSEAPPVNGKYEQREVGRDGAPSATATTPLASPKPGQTASAGARTGENPQCAAARNNITMLESKAPVQLDSDGDGKPDKTLDDTERGNQLELARAQLKANCGGSSGT